MAQWARMNGRGSGGRLSQHTCNLDCLRCILSSLCMLFFYHGECQVHFTTIYAIETFVIHSVLLWKKRGDLGGGRSQQILDDKTYNLCYLYRWFFHPVSSLFHNFELETFLLLLSLLFFIGRGEG